ncbi:hypothetical protein [Vallitalea okinawensis]|uniref:hypothetical protein n=1 Tax=Vallitalea okinawensis TaxID=2078660 RepID=UPI000CFA94C2|nr:hypothetical protein [Vallitalea okinawensis]
MDQVRSNRRVYSANRRYNTRNYQPRNRRSNTVTDEPTFKIKFYSMQQLVLTVFIFMVVLVLNFLPPTQDLTLQISEIISKDIEIQEVYNNLDGLIQEAQKPLEYLNFIEEW